MNWIKIIFALLLDKLTGLFSKKEPPAPVAPEAVVENVIHVHVAPTATPAPAVEIVEAKKPKKKKK